MAVSGYPEVGTTTIARPRFDVHGSVPIDLLAASMYALLDASGLHELTLETRISGRRLRVWSVDDASRGMTTLELLELGAAVAPTAEPADVVVRWVEGSAEVPPPAASTRIELTARSNGDHVQLQLTYRDLDRDLDIDSLTETLATLVAAVAADPNRVVSTIALASTSQETWLMDASHGTRVDYPTAPTVDALVAEVARAAPDRIAVDGARHVTYGELLERANVVASRLREAGSRPGEAIAVLFARGIECIIAMLGVLLADGVYVPIPIDEPEPRRNLLLDLVSARLVLRPADDPTGIELQQRDAPGIVVPGFSTELRAMSPIYVMFTSGSTGVPKAVVVAHEAVIRLVRDPWFIGISPDDGVAFASNPGFDAASWEVWGALCNGARSVVVEPGITTHPEALDAVIRERRVTCLFLTTSLFNSHARTEPGMFGALRVLGIGGEAADAQACRRVLLSKSPPRSLVNAYGPTEAATFASWYEITDVPEDALRVPIGHPICNTALYVLDPHGRLLPPGIAGELFIGGDAPALCYLGDAELTERKFVPDPFAGSPHRLYATGDSVVRRSDGALVYLGRLDEQLKIRGFRVEPREVERAIRSIPGVATAVAVGRVVDGYARLVAYVVTADEGGPDPASIRKQLRAQFPEYLVPAHVVRVDDLPLTKSGKLDRARLPDPFASHGLAGSASVGPPDHVQTEDERLSAAITDIWSDVLRLETIDPDASFFDAGGDSLLAVRLYGAVQRRFGVVLPGGLVAEELTITSFSAAVRRALEGATPPMVIELTATDGPPVLIAAAGGGEFFSYRWLIRLLGSEFRLIGLREPGHYGTERRPRTVAEVSTVWTQALRRAGIERPIAVVGECAGGVLAHALACDLERAGRGPGLVALLETPMPSSGSDEDEDEDEAAPRWRRSVDTVRRRGHNAAILAVREAQWTWFRARGVPAPPTLAHAMTVRANARRIRSARPSFFPGRQLYVQALGTDGETRTEGAAEYWSQFAAATETITVPGAHAGNDWYLSPSHVNSTADVLAHELTVARGGSER